MNDLKELRAIADDLTFAAQKLDGVDGLEALPKIVSDTHQLNLDLKKIKPWSIISNSFFGLLLGVLIGAFAGYKYASPLELASSTWGLSVMYDQNNNAKFAFQKDAWRGVSEENFWVIEQKPEVQESSLARKLGEKTLEALDDTK